MFEEDDQSLSPCGLAGFASFRYGTVCETPAAARIRGVRGSLLMYYYLYIYYKLIVYLSQGKIEGSPFNCPHLEMNCICRFNQLLPLGNHYENSPENVPRGFF